MFDQATGHWKFSPKSISQQSVDRDPFSEKLIKDVADRHQHSKLYPDLPSETCPCKVSSKKINKI